MRDDLRVDLRLAYYPSSTSGVVYRVSGAAPGLCGKDDARVVVESVMAATGWRHQLITPCASAPLALQTEVRRDGFTWTVPASALPRELRSGTRLTDLRADSGWVQHYFDYAGVVRGYGAYEAADQATGRATVVLR